MTEPEHIQAEALVRPIIEGMGFEVVEINLLGQGKRRTFQILVDKPGGIVIEDCTKISRNLSRLMDVEDPFPFEYSLEVGSPGIFRELKNDRDFERHKDDRVKVKLLESLLESYTFIGTLVGYDSQNVLILDEAGAGELTIERTNIKRLHLEPKL